MYCVHANKRYVKWDYQHYSLKVVADPYTDPVNAESVCQSKQPHEERYKTN